MLKFVENYKRTVNVRGVGDVFFVTEVIVNPTEVLINHVFPVCYM